MKKTKGFGKQTGTRSISTSADLEKTWQTALQYCTQNRLPEAKALFEQLLQVLPNHPGCLLNLGVLLHQLGDNGGALRKLTRLIELEPGNVAAHHNLGNVFLALGKTAEAESSGRRALALRPDHPETLNNLGVALKKLGNLEEAEACFCKALVRKPEYIDALSNLGNILVERRQIAEAIDVYRRVLVLQPGLPAGHSNLLLALQYSQNLTQDDWKSALAAFDRSLRSVPRFSHSPISLPTDRRLRVGYVSPDFCEHSCAWFIEPLLAHHDRQRFETFCYSAVANPDSTTARLQGLAEHWHTITGLHPTAVAQNINSHGIDILVDLTGHTASNKLALFAHKPAPVQVSWLGYPASTGLQTMDYRLSDRWLTPEGTDEHFGETIWNLDRPSHSYLPPTTAPGVAALPALASSRVTFGSFNSLVKVTDQTIALWAAVLQAIPESHLLIKARQAADPAVQRQLTDDFARHGIAPDRIGFLGRVPGLVGHLECYNRVDVALDTYPYNGATTTMEALWMGVPVVSLIGERSAARYGLSFLSAVGLEALAAESEQTYVQAVLDLVGDLEKLGQLRRQLRERVAGSLLCNGPDFAAATERAYQQMVYQRSG